MSERSLPRLKIDKAFKYLIPPLTSDEYRQLEINLLSEGCRDPICIWNDTIIDGHNRYEICLRHEIPFRTLSFNFRGENEAIVWICANQIGRRNISEETRRYLIGKRYESEKIIDTHNIIGKNQYSGEQKEVRTEMSFGPNSPMPESRTARKLGNEYHLSHATITKYGSYSRAIDTLTKKNEEMVPKILSGQTKISQENVILLSKLSPQELKRVSRQLLQNDRDFVGYNTSRKNLNGYPREKGIRIQSLPETTVKDMPQFDPDAEVSSLSLTIPSWISLLERTQTSTDFVLVSDAAKTKLSNMLINLVNAVDIMLHIMRDNQ